jgi:aminobenzoyl-glutamate utilization protein B
MLRLKSLPIVVTALLVLLVIPFRHAGALELTPAMKTAISWVEQNKATYDNISRYIWDNPELSLVEFKSSAKLQEYLAGNGFKIEKGVASMATAFVATWGSGKPVIGIMGEFDALPNLSQEAGVTTRKPVIAGAPGHGCGHNLFGTSSATAAIAITKAMEKHGIKGTVKFFGTPAEETLVGKVYMNRDGVFDGADIIIDWHPGDSNGVGYSSLLAMDNMKFRFHGRASHAGAAPEAGRSALDAVELMNAGANFMREHVVQEARIHYVITKGGEAPNIVPNIAEVWYYFRAPRRAQVDEMRNWLTDIAKGAALMTQTRMEYQLMTAVYERLTNRALAQMGNEIVKSVGAPSFNAEDQKFGDEVIKSLGRKAAGEAFSTKIDTPDFSKVFPDVNFGKASADLNYTWKIPSMTFSVATYAKGTPGHSWQAVCSTRTDPTLKAGLQVSKYMAAAGLEILTNQKLVREAQEEFSGYIARFGYKEPVPMDVKVPSFQDLYGIEPTAVPGARK